MGTVKNLLIELRESRADVEELQAVVRGCKHEIKSRDLRIAGLENALLVTSHPKVVGAIGGTD